MEFKRGDFVFMERYVNTGTCVGIFWEYSGNSCHSEDHNHARINVYYRVGNQTGIDIWTYHLFNDKIRLATQNEINTHVPLWFILSNLQIYGV